MNYTAKNNINRSLPRRSTALQFEPPAFHSTCNVEGSRDDIGGPEVFAICRKHLEVSGVTRVPLVHIIESACCGFLEDCSPKPSFELSSVPKSLVVFS